MLGTDLSGRVRRTHQELVSIARSVSIVSLRHGFGGDNLVLDGIDLGIESGSFVALLGPSGCGKSTLLRLIAGLDTPTAGSISVLAPGETTREGGAGQPDFGFVFQDAHLLPWRSVLDNVLLPLELRRVNDDAARARARAALADVELGDAIGRFPDELSGGMRMRVSIARALVTNPGILLLDEPFAALDELTRQRLDERLRALWLKKRMTVIFVTHSIGEAVFLAERALVMSMRPGRIVLDHRISFSNARSGDMRTSVEFAQQTATLYQALEAHDPGEQARPS